MPSLDGIRAISIAMVVVGHAAHTLPVRMGPQAKLWDIIAGAQRGVSIFFVVSGFIITTLLLRERETRGNISLRAFYFRRCFRIVPPFYVFLFCLAIAWKVGWIELGWKSLLVSAAFLRDYVNTGDWWTWHTWSLSIEEQFYLLWPAALVLFGARRMRGIAVQLIFVAPVLRLVTTVLLPNPSDPIGLMFHMRVDGLMCGCLLAIMRAEPDFAEKYRRWLRWDIAALAAILLFVVSTALFWKFSVLYWLVAGSSLENLCISYLLLYTVEFPRSAPGLILNLPAVVHIGQVSYSLYLWQQVFVMAPNTSVLGRFPFNIMAAFTIAELSWWLVEKPSLALRHRIEIHGKPKVRLAPAE